VLRLTNTLTRTVETVVTLEAGRISMYSCGPTVYRYAHVGNMRTYALADLIRRVLIYHGLEVRSVMNITDVGHMTDELTDSGRDRMELAVEDEGLPAADIARRYTEAFLTDCDRVGIGRFDEYPAASDHVPQMVDMTARLVERGHAYERGGSVYFDVSTFPGYGALSGQSLEDMRAGHRVDVDPAKRNHQDFLLWKSAGPDRAVRFDSPWGPGFPGWHIECSAMSIHLLGSRFDIHTGGIDNVFPHHTDERAQSDAATGHEVVRMWVHGDHLLADGAKMAKSARNVVTVGELLEDGFDPLALRALFWSARYRRQVDFTRAALEAAATGLRRLRERIAALGRPGPAPSTDAGVRDALTEGAALAHHDRFMRAIDDDLDVPAAMAALHEMVGDDHVAPDARVMLAGSWDNVLGLRLVEDDAVSSRVIALIEERDRARLARDYARADRIREELAAEGVDLMDTDGGTRWVRRG